MKLTLHIERLVLDGLPASVSSRAFQAALEHELALLLAQRPLAALSGGAMSQMGVPMIKLPPGSRPAQWGRQVARSLCDGLAPAATAASNKPRVPVASPP